MLYKQACLGVERMVVSLRKWLERAKFISLFFVCTFVIYQLLHGAAVWLTPHTKFGEPAGHAVKVYAADGAADNGGRFVDRLRFFYWYGE